MNLASGSISGVLGKQVEFSSPPPHRPRPRPRPLYYGVMS